MVGAVLVGGCGADEAGGGASTTTVSTTPSSTTQTAPAAPTVDATLVDPPARVQPLPPAAELLAIAADPTEAAARAASVLALTSGGGADFAAATDHPIEDWVVVNETDYRTPEYVLAVLDVEDGAPAVRALAVVSQGGSDSAGFRAVDLAERRPVFERGAGTSADEQGPLDWQLESLTDRGAVLAVTPVFCNPEVPLDPDSVRAWVWREPAGVAIYLTSAVRPPDPLTRELCAQVDPVSVDVVLPESMDGLALLDARTVPPSAVGGPGSEG